MARIHEDEWAQALAERTSKQLKRTRHHEKFLSSDSGRPNLDFTSFDYLQLSRHPHVIQEALHALQQYGVGKCSSRVMSGGYELIDQLEGELSRWYGKEDCLLFPSGYQANVSFLPALLNQSSLVIADKYIHRSLIDGIKLSGAKMLRYPHGDLRAMEQLLQKYHSRVSHIVCVTESVFSMHGTQTDCEEFCQIASRYGALSCIDDAHGFGLCRQNEKERLSTCDCVITTLSKTLGAQGGAVLGSITFIEYLVNFSSGFIYTTSLSPAIVGGALASLHLLPSLQKEREHLWFLIECFTRMLSETTLKGHGGDSHIQAVMLGTSEQALSLQQYLKTQQIDALAVRPPTVPPNGAMIRFLLTSGHSQESLQILFQGFCNAAKR